MLRFEQLKNYSFPDAHLSVPLQVSDLFHMALAVLQSLGHAFNPEIQSENIIISIALERCSWCHSGIG